VTCFLLSACFKAVKNGNITGSQDGGWPWQATLFINNSLHGGSLITDQWVLTAASFITLSDRPNTVVYLGLHNISEPYAVTRTLENITCHPKYNSSTHENDICLLKLSAPVNFTDYIQPICLASENSTFHSGTSSWITGFGGGSCPSILKEVNGSIVGANECKCYYKNLTGITENMICAGLSAGRMSPIYRDLGGPLISNKDSIWVQSGVANVGAAGFFNPMRPGVYTRVSHRLIFDWTSNACVSLSLNQSQSFMRQPNEARSALHAIK
uniref:Peptidase S1 domain-containing protein n=1 Tax=Amphilophus citrinellus TaxID=61819 RepID=A0A3Q0R8W7_AMPCI